MTRVESDNGMSQHMILFVCTGNICRSPMAEYLLRERLPDDSAWIVRSAGLFAGRGMLASRPAIDVLMEKGIDISAHRSRQLSNDLVDAATLIVVMTASHNEQVRAVFSGAQTKVYSLKFFDPAADGDVGDPIGSAVNVYRRARDEIDAALPGLISFLENMEGVSAA